DVEYDPVEKRFIGINEENKYSKETGYGWESNVVLSVTRKPTVDFRVLRGARFIGAERQEYEKSLISSYPDIGVPTEYLYPDFVSSKSPASFRVNVPDGKYQLSFLIGDVSDSPVNHGTMDITVNSTNIISGLEIPKGEVRQVRAEVRVSSGSLRIDLRPGEWSEWLLNGLIITEMKPHIGHLPIYSALKGTDLTIGVTVTSSFPLAGVWLFYKEERVFISSLVKKYSLLSLRASILSALDRACWQCIAKLAKSSAARNGVILADRTPFTLFLA
ncbi:unnamed protein product, partial [marine sediment metagenome]